MKSKKLIVPPRKFFHGGHYIISFFFIGWFCTYIKNTIKISIILGFFFLNFWGPWDPAPASSTPGPTDVMLLFIHVPFFFYLYVVLTMASHGYQWSLYTNNNNNKKKALADSYWYYLLHWRPNAHHDRISYQLSWLILPDLPHISPLDLPNYRVGTSVTNPTRFYQKIH